MILFSIIVSIFTVFAISNIPQVLGRGTQPLRAPD